MSATPKTDRLEEIAVRMAPSFTFKFDFSKPEDFDSLADLAITSAQAIDRKLVPMRATEEAEAAAALIAAEKARLAETPPTETRP